MSVEDISNSQLMQAINSLREEGVKNKEDIKQDIKIEITKLAEHLGNHNRQLADLSKEVADLKNWCGNLDKQNRKNNIVLHGLPVPPEIDILTCTLEKLKILNVNIQENDINNIYQLKGQDINPIKIEFTTYLKKNQVWKNRSNLKGANLYIVHDLSLEERGDQKVLRRYLQRAKAEKYVARIKGKTLIVNNQTFSVQHLKNLDVQYKSNDCGQLHTLLKLQSTAENRSQISGSISEKRGNTSPIETHFDFEKLKVPRTNSTSSVSSDKSDRATRQNRIRK